MHNLHFLEHVVIYDTIMHAVICTFDKRRLAAITCTVMQKSLAYMVTLCKFSFSKQNMAIPSIDLIPLMSLPVC